MKLECINYNKFRTKLLMLALIIQNDTGYMYVNVHVFLWSVISVYRSIKYKNLIICTNYCVKEMINRLADMMKLVFVKPLQPVFLWHFLNNYPIITCKGSICLKVQQSELNVN